MKEYELVERSVVNYRISERITALELLVGHLVWTTALLWLLVGTYIAFKFFSWLG